MTQTQSTKVKTLEEFFGAEGLLAQMFTTLLEELLEAELSEHLGYERYEAKGRNSGNSRNGHTSKRVKSRVGDTKIQVPRDRAGTFDPQVLKKYQGRSEELEEQIIGFYSRGLSQRDIQESLVEMYGIEVSPEYISKITDKVWSQVEAWQTRPLQSHYPIIYLDAMFLPIRQEGRVRNTPAYNVLAIDLDGKCDVLGHWIGDGGEGANFWLTVITELQQRGVEDIFIACVDGLQGFGEAIQAVFPQAIVQQCVIHAIRHASRYVARKELRAFLRDLKLVYQAPTRDDAERNLQHLAQRWQEKYPLAIRSWQNRWHELSAFFDFPQPIRQLIYTTNRIEAYHRQLRRVTKNKSALPTPKSARKLLFLATRRFLKKSYGTTPYWGTILNQLAIRFDGRFPL